MTGTILNCAGILLGAVLGKIMTRAPQRITEAYIRVILAACIVLLGLRLSWISINGPFLSILAQILVLLLSLTLGKMLGRLCRLQKLSNRLGQFARERIASANNTGAERFNNGFLTCTALFCAAPLAIVGAVADGLTGYYYPLVAKALIEGLAAFGFARVFGWGVALSFLPVLAFQGTITLLCKAFEPALSGRDLVDPVTAVGGVLVFSVALLMLEIKKLHLADYLPSLAVAPLLTWLIRSF